MRAEVLLDCITQVTETTNRFPGLPLGGRAVQIPDGRTPNYFLTTFGRATRTTACTCEVKTTPTLSQALHLLNGETTTGKIVEGKVVEKLLAAKNGAGGGGGGALPAVPGPQADAGRGRAASPRDWPAYRTRRRRSKTCSGRSQHERVHLQPIAGEPG